MAVATAAAVGLVTGMAAANGAGAAPVGTNGAGAAPAGTKLAPGVKTSQHRINSNRGARPSAQSLLPKKGTFAFLLRLDASSTSTVYARTKRSTGTASAKRAARSQLSSVSRAQSSVIAALPARSHVLYRTHAAMAGVAVLTDVKNFDALRRINGVAAVYPIATKRVDNSYAVPFQRGAAAWQAYGDLGQDSTVAIIDTGVDYTHANFGGPGTVAAYDAAKAADTTLPHSGWYDATKFDFTTKDAHDANPAYMYDFAGDTYNANPAPDTAGGEQPYQPTPHPDPNPLDCTDHGSHVAGTAAGFGENADGSTYRGTYDQSTPFDTMRLGRGVAPKARIYAYKVFGCSGSTDIVGEAIDKAMDPNGDGDTSDHADVVNMSLGGDYGFPDDGDSVLTNYASQIAGVTMVVASGNGGDVYDIGGSPGDAVRSIAVANSQDAYSQVDALNVSAPDTIAGDYASERSAAYDWATKPDLTGTVARVSDPANLEGCKPLSTADAAAVHGKIAFVDWTDDDNARPCGSVARSGNLAKAGAIGFVFGDDAENFSAGITGSDKIPGVLVAKSGADAIRAQLEAGHAVTISGTTANGFRQLIDGASDSLNDTVNTSSSRGIRDAGNVKPDVTAVGTTVFSTGVGTGNQGLNLTGTSMATPMVAGAAALVKSKHPDWTPEQVKADIMNTADADLHLHPGVNPHDTLYGPNRVGTGRMDIKAALDNSVLAYTVDGAHGSDNGNVSASFGPQAVPVDGPVRILHKTIKVTNTGQDAAHYQVGFVDRTTIPGVTYTVKPDGRSDNVVVVQPHQSATVTLTLRIDPKRLTKTIDPTVDRMVTMSDGNGGTFQVPRQYVADASGLVSFTSTDNGGVDLRVPAYSAPRPVSHMTQPASITMPAGSTGHALLPLSGHQVRQGSGVTSIQSLVAGFELQARSGAAPRCTGTRTAGCWDIPDERAADIKSIGSTSDAQQLARVGLNPLKDGSVYFAINSWGSMRHVPAPQEYDILIDTTGDGVPDALVYTTRIVPSTQDTDLWVAELVDLTGKSPEVVDDEPINEAWGDTDTAAFDTDTFVMPVALGALPKLSAHHPRITYAVFGFDGIHDAPLDNVGDTDVHGKIVHGLSMDVLHPGVSVTGSFNGDGSPLLFEDSPGTVLAVTRNNASYLADKAQGALIVHFHNGLGAKAQVVGFTRANPSAVSLTRSKRSVKHGRALRFTVTVTGSSGTPTGTVTIRRAATRKLAAGVVGTVRLVHGRATLKYRPRIAGRFKYTATYNGDAIYHARASRTVTIRAT